MADRPRAFLPAVYLLALALPLGIAPAEICLGAGLLAWAIGLAIRRGPWVPSPVDLPLLGFAAVGFVSAAFAPVPGASARAALSVWTLFPFFLAREAAVDLRTVRRLLLLLLTGALLAASMGIAEGILADEPAFQDFLERVDVPAPDLNRGRVTGFFSHHITFAGQQALLLVTFAALAAGRFLVPRLGAGWLVPLAAMALALVFTAARAPFAAALLGLAAVAVLSRGRRARLVAGVAVGGLVLAAVAGGAVLGDRLTALGDGPAEIGRVDMWHAALGMLREHSLLGVGPGGYREKIGRWVDLTRYHPAHAHSTPFQVAAETGIVGLAAWILIWVAFFGALAPRAWKMRRDDDPRAALPAAALLAMVVFLAAGIFEYNLGDAEVAMLASFIAGLPFGRAFYGKPPA